MSDTATANGRAASHAMKSIAVKLASYESFRTELESLGGRQHPWESPMFPAQPDPIEHGPPLLLNRADIGDDARAHWDTVYPPRTFEPRALHPQAMFEVPGGRLIAPGWACLTPGGQILRWSYRVAKFFRHPVIAPNRIDATIDIVDAERHLEGNIGIAGPMEYGNFYHWMVEGLPRAHMLRATYGSDFKLAIPRRSPAFVLASLKMIGFADTEIIRLSRRFTYRCDTVLMAATPIRSIVDYTPWLLDWFETISPPAPTAAGAILYISRQYAGARRVLNEAELIRALGPDVEVAHFEKLNLDQQIAKVRSARAIVSPHGAGLTHMLFANPGSRLVELLPDSVRAPSSFWAICDQRNLPYAAVLGKAVDPDRGGNTDFTVPETAFGAIRSFLGEAPAFPENPIPNRSVGTPEITIIPAKVRPMSKTAFVKQGDGWLAHHAGDFVFDPATLPEYESIEARARMTQDSGRHPLWEGYADVPDYPKKKTAERDSNQVRTSSNIGAFYARLAEQRNAQAIIEFGTAFGVSGMFWLAGLKRTGGHLFTYEPNAVWAELARENLASVSSAFTLTEGTFEDNAATTLGDTQVDIAFIDAIHTAEFVDAQYAIVRRHMRPGGLVIFDDVNFSDSMRGCWDAIANSDSVVSSLAVGRRLGIVELP